MPWGLTSGDKQRAKGNAKLFTKGQFVLAIFRPTNYAFSYGLFKARRGRVIHRAGCVSGVEALYLLNGDNGTRSATTEMGSRTVLLPLFFWGGVLLSCMHIGHSKLFLYASLFQCLT